MARIPKHQRPRDIKPGRVDAWGQRMPGPAELAPLVTYRGSGEHKRYSSPTGEWTPNLHSDKAKCDRYAWRDWPLLVQVLRDAMLRSCVQLDPADRFPTRVWAYINGTLHEARITNAMTGEYHGFPLECQSHEPRDPHDLLKDAPRVAIPRI